MRQRPHPQRTPGARARGLLAALLLPAGACLPRGEELTILPPTFEGGSARLEILLGGPFGAGSLRIRLDGEPVEDAFAPFPGGLAARFVLGAGAHRLVAEARAAEGEGAPTARDALDFVAPPPLPALLASDPAPGARGVAPSAWLRLDFAASLAAAAPRTLGLRCAGEARAFHVHALEPTSLVLNPLEDLPAAAACELAWLGPGGPEALAFATAPPAPPATVLYDRRDPLQLAPFPDDFWLADDAGTRTGYRLALPVPPLPSRTEAFFEALIHDTRGLDGFSPIGHFVLELSGAPDPASLPRTPAESLDALASVGLFDLTPGSPAHGRRVPFRIEVRDDATPEGLASHVLLLFPSVPLRPEGRYALVVTRRALAAGGGPLEPSPFLHRALGPPRRGERAEVARVRAHLAPVLEALEGGALSPPLPREDLALVLRVSVRSTDDLPTDLLAMRAQVLAEAPPRRLSLRVRAEDPEQVAAGSEVAAVVEGTWDAPDWRPRHQGVPGPNLARDAEGLPLRQGSRPVEFRLAIPTAALWGPVPVIVHQHGNPGGHEEVLANARRFLSQAGFAVIGFTDVLNREVAPETSDRDAAVLAQIANMVGNLLANQTLPEHWVESTGEQIAFLRFVQTLGDLDVLPVGAPDGVPELDLQAPLSYHGISEGANAGQALLAYAPEIEAAALVGGGARLGEALVHQQADLLVGSLAGFLPGATPAHVWCALALFQAIFDAQDPHNHLEFVQRRPLPLAESGRRASVLLIEGLDDSFVPNHASQSAAFALGPLPLLAPVQRPVPFLPVALGPLRGNLGAGRTGALVQYAPRGVAGVPPTPGCVPPEVPEPTADEGHFCAQRARESLLQRAVFFRTAVDEGEATVVDPLLLLE